MSTTTLRYVRWGAVAATILALLSGGPIAALAASRQRGHGKLSAKVRERAAARRGTEMVDVLVRFKKAPGPGERRLMGRLGGQTRRLLRDSSRWVSLRLPARTLAALAESDVVEFVASDEPVASAMDVVRTATNEPGPAAPESAYKGEGVTIAMLDSGVAPHPDIQGLVASVDFAGNLSPTPVFDTPEDPQRAEAASVDPNGHGTHVAGILIGTGAASAERSLAGLAPAAKLVSVRVLDGAGGGRTSDMLAALQWVRDNKDALGIRVLNLSLGHPIHEPAADDPLVQEVDALWDAGVVVVCSAGNRGRNGNATISSPCNSRKVISVGAANARKTPEPFDDAVATYSSRGPTPGRVVKPDLVAPGNKIASTRAPGSHLDQYVAKRVAADPALPEVQDYFEMSGTSMSAPMVSAAAALMLQKDPGLNPGTVKARLMLSARKPAVGTPFGTGAGMLDIAAALNATGTVADAPSPLVFADPGTSLLGFENTGTLWGNPDFGLPSIWSSAVLWDLRSQATDPVLYSYGALVPELEASASGALWGEATLWAEASLWSESTLWSEAVLWTEESEFAEPALESLGELVEDP
jgi:serine protease AprX